MRVILFCFVAAFWAGCSTTAPYTWQDTRQPEREDSLADLEYCRTYAARQYRPGIPAGDAYLDNRERSDDSPEESKQQEWRPDRSPYPVTNINEQTIHKVPVDYTGYPGELDYSPGYLDAILEKCMFDRGWEYRPETEEK